VDEVPRDKPSLLALDQQQALARQDEEVLLVRLPVVEGARFPRLQHAEREPNLPERRRPFAFERAGGAERLVRHPRGIPHIDDEPALGHGREAGIELFKTRFLDHYGSSPRASQPQFTSSLS
jgi:hypothetical protein